MSEWQPIETAPEDGSNILLWNGFHMDIGSFARYARDKNGLVIGAETEDQSRFVDYWQWSGEGFDISPPPTHWQPLPEPPK